MKFFSIKPTAKAIAPIALSLGLLGSSPAFGGPPGEAEKAFYKAFYLESGLRNFDEAQEAYAKASAVAADEGNNALVSQAMVGHARCLQSLGRMAEARRAFENVLRLDPSNKEAKAALTDRVRSSVTGDVDPELRLRIQALVQKLAGPERENASEDLRKIGETAVPFLADGLRSRDVAVVEWSANILFRLGSAAAADALIGGLGDEEVLFQHLVADGIMHLSRVSGATGINASEIERVARVGLDHPSRDVRATMAKWSVHRIRERGTELGSAFVIAAIERIAADVDSSVRASLLDTSLADRLASGGDSEDLLLRVFPGLIEAARDSSDNDRSLKAFHTSYALARKIEGFRGLVLTFANHADPAVRDYVISVAADWLGDGGAHDSAVWYVIDQALRSESDERVLKTASGILARTHFAWPVDVRKTAFERLLGQIRSGDGGSGDFMPLLEAESPSSFDDAQLAKLYAALPAEDGRTVSARGSKTSRERRHILRRYFPDRGGEGSDADARRFLLFAEQAVSSTEDATGRAGVLDNLPPGFMEQPGAVEFMVRVASDSESTVRSRAYSALSRVDSGRDAGELPFLREDVASGGTSAFTLILDNVSSDDADAVWSFLSHRISSRKAVGLTGSDVWVMNGLGAFVKAAGTDGNARLRTLLSTEGSSERSFVVRSLLANDPSFVADLAEGRVDLPELSSSDIYQLGLLCEPLAMVIPAERLTSKWMSMHRVVSSDVTESLMRRAFMSGDSSVQLQGLELAETLATSDDLAQIVRLADHGTVQVRGKASAILASVQARLENRATVALFGPGGKVAALDRARKMAGSENPKLRQGAALALGALGDAAAVPVLMDLLEDSEESVQDAAIRALETLGASGK